MTFSLDMPPAIVTSYITKTGEREDKDVRRKTGDKMEVRSGNSARILELESALSDCVNWIRANSPFNAFPTCIDKASKVLCGKTAEDHDLKTFSVALIEYHRGKEFRYEYFVYAKNSEEAWEIIKEQAKTWYDDDDPEETVNRLLKLTHHRRPKLTHPGQ